MSTTFPPSEPGRHGINELLTLVGEIRRLAFGTLPPAPRGGVRVLVYRATDVASVGCSDVRVSPGYGHARARPYGFPPGWNPKATRLGGE